MRRLWISLVWVAACGGAGSGVDDSDDPSDTTDTTEDPASTVDPMVGDWICDRIVQDGESRDLPAQDGAATWSMEMSFTAEGRGLLTQIFESEEDGQREAFTFEFVDDGGRRRGGGGARVRLSLAELAQHGKLQPDPDNQRRRVVAQRAAAG
jgi:hypothetical protein